MTPPPQVRFAEFRVCSSTKQTLSYEFKLPFAQRFEGENIPKFQVRSHRDYQMVLGFAHGRLDATDLYLLVGDDTSYIMGTLTNTRQLARKGMRWLRDWARYSMAVAPPTPRRPKVTPKGTPVAKPREASGRPLRTIVPD